MAYGNIFKVLLYILTYLMTVRHNELRKESWSINLHAALSLHRWLSILPSYYTPSSSKIEGVLFFTGYLIK